MGQTVGRQQRPDDSMECHWFEDICGLELHMLLAAC